MATAALEIQFWEHSSKRGNIENSGNQLTDVKKLRGLRRLFLNVLCFQEKKLT